MGIRFIGDVHGNMPRYYDIASGAEYSVQLGDFSTSKGDYTILNKLNPVKHKILFGNHDYYPLLYNLPHSLGDFCLCTLNDITFFCVRGSISIDYKVRLANEGRGYGKTWFEEEELNARQGTICLSEYEQIKPKIVVTHDCPVSFKPYLGNTESIMRLFGFPAGYNCSTQYLLQQMLDIHRPDLWIFGHWHRSIDQIIDGTHFKCLSELEYFDFDPENF